MDPKRFPVPMTVPIPLQPGPRGVRHGSVSNFWPGIRSTGHYVRPVIHGAHGLPANRGCPHQASSLVLRPRVVVWPQRQLGPPFPHFVRGPITSTPFGFGPSPPSVYPGSCMRQRAPGFHPYHRNRAFETTLTGRHNTVQVHPTAVHPTASDIQQQNETAEGNKSQVTANTTDGEIVRSSEEQLGSLSAQKEECTKTLEDNKELEDNVLDDRPIVELIDEMCADKDFVSNLESVVDVNLQDTCGGLETTDCAPDRQEQEKEECTKTSEDNKELEDNVLDDRAIVELIDEMCADKDFVSNLESVVDVSLQDTCGGLETTDCAPDREKQEKEESTKTTEDIFELDEDNLLDNRAIVEFLDEICADEEFVSNLETLLDVNLLDILFRRGLESTDCALETAPDNQAQEQQSLEGLQDPQVTGQQPSSLETDANRTVKRPCCEKEICLDGAETSLSPLSKRSRMDTLEETWEDNDEPETSACSK